MSENHTAEAGTITPELVTSKSSANGRKSIFVTGGARGIGRATCELFAAQGWFIGCFDLNAESLLETVKVLGRDNCIAQVLDVTDVAAVQTAVSRFGERTKFTMDLMFNNAGIAIGGAFGDLSHSQHAAQVQINCMGVLNGSYAALGLLKNTPGSLLFNTASSASIRGSPGLATYGATKGFVRLLTESLSAELAPFGVRCADVLPGMITTAMNPDDSPGPAGIGGGDRDPDGPYRRLPATSVAKAVWECYSAGERPHIHWFVPKDLESLDKAVAQDREAARDMHATAAEQGQAAAEDPMEALLDSAGFTAEGALVGVGAAANL